MQLTCFCVQHFALGFFSLFLIRALLNQSMIRIPTNELPDLQRVALKCTCMPQTLLLESEQVEQVII